MKHTFVVCAYKESEYLEECIKTLLAQNVKSHILVATSTPNAHISKLCEKYGLKLRVNQDSPGLAKDWNFAYSQAETELVTLAHQDDVYEPDYTEKILASYKEQMHSLIIFSDYYEYRKNEKIYNNRNLKIKRLLLSPLRVHFFGRSRFVRRRILSLGNPICCPAVTYVKDNLPEMLFKSTFLSNTDWETWEALSKRKGAFVYISKPLMGHRIHEASTTTEIIGENKRQCEDMEMLKKFWPEKIAAIIEKLYSKGEKSNNV